MSNPRNAGTVIGRLTADPKVFTNQDGSKNVKFTIMADHDYTNTQNERGSDAVPVQAFVRAETKGVGPYSNIHKGDQVAVNVRLRQERYTKGGSEVFELKAIATDITFLESRSVTQARMNERVQAAEATNQTLQSQNTAPAPETVAATTVPANAGAAADEQLPFG